MVKKIETIKFCGFVYLKFIEILLRCHLPVPVILIIPAFDEHLIYHADGEQIQIPERQPQLDTPQQKERCRHFPVSWAKFFLAAASVCRFKPHSSMSFGST